MFDENLLSVNAMPDVTTYSQSQPVASSSLAAPRLGDADRRAVDFLLGGDASANLEMVSSPMAQVSFMEHVNALKGLLSGLENLPAEDPSPSLVEATLRKIAAKSSQ